MKLQDYKPLVTLMVLKKFLSASQFSGCIFLHVYYIFPPSWCRSSSPDFLTWLSVQDSQQQWTGGLTKIRQCENSAVPTNLDYEI